MPREFDPNEAAAEMAAGRQALDEFARDVIDEFMRERSPRARVFVSCGQREGVEAETAAKIGEVLQRLGFDFYIAAREASLTGLKENVYRQLEESEYILFVDFRRDQLANKDVYRGSLFSHQELALAAYLGLDWLPFQQSGVERNGIMTFIQSNVTTFSDPFELPDMVEQQVTAKGWSPYWKNGLSFARDSSEYDDATDQTGNTGRFFHASIRNLHRRRLAHDCVAYVERIRDVRTGALLPVRAVELAWAGYGHPAATIIAGADRDLDLGHIYHEKPDVLVFNTFTTSAYFMPPVVGPGEFDISYVVVSDNLPPVRATCRATLSNDLGSTRLRQLPPEKPA